MIGVPMRSSFQPVSTRTRKGCQTCRRRRKRCDEARPACNKCANLGLTCKYDLSLRWGSTRDSFLEGSNPDANPMTMPHDQLGARLREINATPQLHLMIDSTLDSRDREILHRFLTSGYRTLACGFILDDTFLTIDFPKCEHSKACLLNCLTYQVAIDPTYANMFDEYYNRALTQFRREMCNPVPMKEDSLIFAGIFMVSISFLHLLPWTIHLNSVIALLEPRMSLGIIDPQIRNFVSILSFFDLPSHVLNRKTPYHRLSHTHCRGQPGICYDSGLPFSLMDLLCNVDVPGIQHAFLDWPIPDGEPAQKCLWSATRLAGILCANERSKMVQDADDLQRDIDARISPQVLVENILTLVQHCLVFVPYELSSFKQGLIFPLVMAASQRLCLDLEAKDFICNTICHLASGWHTYYNQGVLRLVCDFWASEDETIEQTAQRLDIELSLL